MTAGDRRCIECGRSTKARGPEPRCRACRKQHEALYQWARVLEKKIRREVRAEEPIQVDVSKLPPIDVTLHQSKELHVTVKCPFCYGAGYRTTDAGGRGRCQECRGFGVVRVHERMVPEVLWYKDKSGDTTWTLGTSAVEPNGTTGPGQVRFDLAVRRTEPTEMSLK